MILYRKRCKIRIALAIIYFTSFLISLIQFRVMLPTTQNYYCIHRHLYRNKSIFHTATPQPPRSSSLTPLVVLVSAPDLHFYDKLFPLIIHDHIRAPKKLWIPIHGSGVRHTAHSVRI